MASTEFGAVRGKQEEKCVQHHPVTGSTRLRGYRIGLRRAFPRHSGLPLLRGAALKVLVSGQKWFGRQALDLVLSLGHTAAAVSAPRGTAERPDRLRTRAEHLNLPIILAGSLNHCTMPEGIDLIVCAHSHDFIGRRTRQAARYGAVGYHPSLLPLHRGRDAIRWAVHNRERVTGGTVFWLNDTVDGGPIAAQRHVLIEPTDTAETLWHRELAPLGLYLLRQVLTDLQAGRMVRLPQRHDLATFEPAFDSPRLYRPDLLELGAGGWAGLSVIAEEPHTLAARR